MCDFKIFYGDTFLNGFDMIENNIRHLIELEYYKTCTNVGKECSTIYGIEVIKKEHFKNRTEKEIDNVELLTKDEALIDRIIGKLKEQKVTPVALRDVVQELI